MERLEIIETLKHLPERIEAEIDALPEDVLRYRPAEGEWSINEVVGHLCDLAGVWHKRLYMVWSMTDPLFVSFDGEASIREHAYQQAELKPLISQIRSLRLETVDLLSDAVDWTCTGQQPGVGRRTLKQFAEFVVSHDEDHLKQIRTLKAAAASKGTVEK